MKTFKKLFQSLESILHRRRSGPYAELDPLLAASQASITNTQTSEAQMPQSEHQPEALPSPTESQSPVAPSVTHPSQPSPETPQPPSYYDHPDDHPIITPSPPDSLLSGKQETNFDIVRDLVHKAVTAQMGYSPLSSDPPEFRNYELPGLDVDFIPRPGMEIPGRVPGLGGSESPGPVRAVYNDGEPDKVVAIYGSPTAAVPK